MSALRIAEMRGGSRMAWHCNFSWKSPGFGGQLGAAHFVDVPFVFNALRSDQAKTFLGDNPPSALADAMHSAWVAFAKTGDPGCQASTPSNAPPPRPSGASRPLIPS